jgi:hypothetical protein
VFTVDGGGSRPGAFIETPKLSAEGSVDSGKISFGVGDPKTAVFVDVAHGSLIGVVETSITVDDTAATPLGVNRSRVRCRTRSRPASRSAPRSPS